MSDRIYSIDLISSCHTMFGYFTEFLQSFNWYKHVTLINHYQSIRSIDFVSYFHFVIQRVSKIKLMLPTRYKTAHYLTQVQRFMYFCTPRSQQNLQKNVVIKGVPKIFVCLMISQ